MRYSFMNSYEADRNTVNRSKLGEVSEKNIDIIYHDPLTAK